MFKIVTKSLQLVTTEIISTSESFNKGKRLLTTFIQHFEKSEVSNEMEPKKPSFQSW